MDSQPLSEPKEKEQLKQSATEPASKQVFLNQDLVESIVECFAKSFRARAPPNNQLRSISTVSKAFHRAASIHLWRELDSVLPLSDLLPQSDEEETVRVGTFAIPSILQWQYLGLNKANQAGRPAQMESVLASRQKARHRRFESCRTDAALSVCSGHLVTVYFPSSNWGTSSTSTS